MKKVLACLLTIAIFGVAGFVLAKSVSSKTPPGLDNKPPLEKIIFIHYRKGAKPPDVGKGKGGPACYGFLAKGAKLKGVESLTIHPDLDSTAIVNSAAEWNAHTSTVLFGGYSTDPTANWDSDAPDGRNELLFGNYPDADVIAITVVWGYFSVPPAYRQILEFDVMFDTDWTWGDATIDPGKMDLQNIATHELGHGVGLNDVYQTDCSLVTMYGYSDYGDTGKRTLEAPDIKGLLTLYP